MGVTITYRLSDPDRTYITDKPCSKGHLSPRYISTNQCVECLFEYSQINKRKYRLARYGITEDDYSKLIISQNYVCAICKQPETSTDGATGETKILSVDHCHSSNKVRGLLCNNCNQGLGKFKDSVEILQSAIECLKVK